MFHRTHFFFPHHRHAGQQQGNEHYNRRDDPGYVKITAGQVRIKPGPGLEIDPDGLPARTTHPFSQYFKGVVSYDISGIVQDYASRVGIGAVDNNLHGSCFACGKLAAEVRRKAKNGRHFSPVDDLVHFLVASNHFLDGEVARVDEPVNQVPALRRLRLVVDGSIHVLHVGRHCITENHALKQRHHQHNRPHF